MAEFSNTPINEAPTPQESPGASTTPEAGSDGNIKKARTTVILREVDPAATEEQILALFDKTDLKVVSARPDVQNCWFVQLETEDMAKQAALHLTQQTLCGQPVKPRIKSEGTLRTSAPAWQPTVAPSALYPNQAFHPAAGFVAPAPTTGQASFNNWTGTKPASINKPPPEGGFKKQSGAGISGGETAPFVQGSNQQQSTGSGRGSGSKKGSSGQGRTSGGGERKGRRGSQGAQAAPKQASFQPTDFPSLTGGSAPVTEPTIAAAPVPVQEAPANSWAARAKSTAEAAAVAPQKKKEPMKAPAEVKEQQKAPRKDASQASESAEKPQTAPVQQETANPTATVTPPAAAKSPEIAAHQQDTAAAATEAKRRGWEKPGLPQIKKEASPPATTNPSPSPTPETSSKTPSGKSDATAEKPSKDSKQQRQSGGSSGRRSASKEKGESNGHPSQPPPVVPLPWGNKSFAQVIKEPPAAQPAPSAPSTAANNSTLLPALKSNENWGDVEDDDLPAAGSAKTASASRSGGNATSRPAVGAQLEKLRPNSESSSDWRRDAAARRKNEEQATSGTRTGSSKRPNGS